MYDDLDLYDDSEEWYSWDEVIYDSLDSLQVSDDAVDCYAYYGKQSHISIDGGQPQPLDDELFQPADLLELFRYVSVVHMAEHIEDAIDILSDAAIATSDDLYCGVTRVFCGGLEIRFPAIPWDDVQHYVESVK